MRKANQNLQQKCEITVNIAIEELLILRQAMEDYYELDADSALEDLRDITNHRFNGNDEYLEGKVSDMLSDLNALIKDCGWEWRG